MAIMGFGNATISTLAAYASGQALTLVLLIRTIARGMEAGGGRDFSVLMSLRVFPRLVGVGLLYNAAIWVDKMVFWFRDGVGPHPWVRYHPLYDTCSFLAYLTVVPALAVNLIRLETSFYEHYRGYYGSILGNTPLGIIEDKRSRMFENLQEGTVRLLRVQGAITALIIIFAPVVIDVLKLPPAATRLFRLTCLGAFFHVMLLLTILMQLYFDLRAQALGTSAVFLILNGGLAWWSVDRGMSTYGIGYAIAGFLSLLLGYSLLHRSLQNLDYLTFTGQPIADDEDLPPIGEAESQDWVRAPVETGEEEEAEPAAGEMAPPTAPRPLIRLDVEPEPEAEPEEEESPHRVTIHPEAAPDPEPKEPVTATDVSIRKVAAPVDRDATETEIGFDRLPEAEKADPEPAVDPAATATELGFELAAAPPGEPAIEVPEEEEAAEEAGLTELGGGESGAEPETATDVPQSPPAKRPPEPGS